MSPQAQAELASCSSHKEPPREGQYCSTTGEKLLTKSNKLSHKEPETSLAPCSTSQQLITALRKDVHPLPAPRTLSASAPFASNASRQQGHMDAASLAVHTACSYRL